MASRKTEEMKQRLLEERDALLRQKEALDHQIKGLERAIQLVSAEDVSTAATGKRTQIKAVVLDLLEQVGTSGLDAQIAVQLANEKGITMKLNSVSSLLSRLKADGAVAYDGELYRLKKFAKSDPQPEDPFALKVVKHL